MIEKIHFNYKMDLVTPSTNGQKIFSCNIRPKINNYDFFGKQWYTHLVQPQKWYGKKPKWLLEDYKQEDLKSHLVICYTQKYTNYVQYLYAVFDSYVEFYPHYSKFQDKSFYEVVQFIQKPHFDIDMDYITYMEHYSFDKPYHYEEFCKIGEILIETIIRACTIIMRPNVLNLNKDVLVYTSHGKSKGKDKLSYHIVINHWCHIDEVEAGAFFEKVYHLTSCLLNGRYVEWIDSRVYKSRQNFRLVGSHKCDNDRVKIFNNEFMYFGEKIIHEPDHLNNKELNDFSKSLITFTSGCRLLQSFKEYKNYTPYDYDITEDDLKEIEVMLNKQFKNQFSVREVNKNKVQLKKKNPYYCPLCLRIHYHENPLVIVYESVVKFSCRRHEDNKKLLLGYLTKKIEEDVDDEPCNFLSFGDYTIDMNTGNKIEDIVEIEIENNLCPVIPTDIDIKPEIKTYKKINISSKIKKIEPIAEPSILINNGIIDKMLSPKKINTLNTSSFRLACK